VRNRCVALATRDPVLYAELAAALRERRIPSISVLPGDRLPDRVGVVLTSPEEVERIRFSRVIPVTPTGGHAGLWAAVNHALTASEWPRELIIGVDPGPRPGYAVMGGDRSLEEGTLGEPEDVGHLSRQLKRRFPSTHLKFRVGRGDRIPRDRIVNALASLHADVELVDERNTTPHGKRRDRDPASARLIARSPGPPAERVPAVRALAGEIADLQRRSREASGGRFTIPRGLASRVLEGKLSFPEALRQASAREPRTRSSASATTRANQRS
jgi:hypothetical protein